MNIFERIIGSDNLEKQRYDIRANSKLRNLQSKKFTKNDPFLTIDSYLQEPYKFYLKILKENLSSNKKVLEIGCGTGNLSEVLLQNANEVYFLDISQKSLEFLKKRYAKYKNFKCINANMDQTPFENESFDLIVTAGSLSYANNKYLMKEILRLLKKNGSFICVDTINSNPIYILFRIINIILLKRSLITFYRIPNLFTISFMRNFFTKSKIKYFGSISFLMPFLNILIKDDRCKKLSSECDKILKNSFFAYKFVLNCKK
jgi:Methylase involved in ubiquinone/menaquinone biosynthesis